MRILTRWVAVLAVSVAVACSLGASTANAEPKVKVKRPSSVRVIDANGKTVLVRPANPEGLLERKAPLFFVAVGEHTFSLEVFRDGFGGRGDLYYVSTDCSGQPFMAPDSDLDWSVVGRPGNTVYVQGPEEPEDRYFLLEGTPCGPICLQLEVQAGTGGQLQFPRSPW